MLQVIAYGLPLTALDGVAALEQLALPVTPEVASVSPFLNPLSVARKLGLASPYSRLALRSEEHTSELQSQSNLVCRLLLEKKKTGLKQSPLLGVSWVACRTITT